MSKITRYIPKCDVITWHGTEIGVRLPFTDEMMEISKLRDAVIQSNAASGDDETAASAMALIVMQKYISATLACDPDDSTVRWFAPDRAKQAELLKDNIERDTPDDVPFEFHLAVSNFFLTRSREDAKKRDEANPTPPSPDSTAPPST